MERLTLVDMKVFKPVHLKAGDTLKLTYTVLGTGEVYSHSETVTKDTIHNCCRVYTAAEFDGLKYVFILVAGYKS
jgi:hypothetical protein